MKLYYLAVFFVSFSVTLFSLGISYSVKSMRLSVLTKEFRRIAILFSVFILEDLIIGYLESLSLVTVPHWALSILWYTGIIVFIFLGCLSPKLILSFYQIEFSKKLSNIFMLISIPLIILFVSMDMIFHETIYSEIASSIMPVLFFMTTSIGSIVYSILKNRKSQNPTYKKIRSGSSIIFISIYLLIIVVILEDLVFAFFTNDSFYPYLFIMLSLFLSIYLVSEEKRNSGVIGIQNPDLFYSHIVSNYGVSERELDVVKLLLQGQSKQKIAKTLFIAENTVKTHITKIYRKLEISSRFELFSLINSWK